MRIAPSLVDETMDTNDASANWERLFARIRRGDTSWIKLGDDQAGMYDFTNELLMRTTRERLVEAIQIQNQNWRDTLTRLEIGNLFFATMNEQQQRSFFRRFVALPVRYLIVGDATNSDTEKPAITICTPALLDALPGFCRPIREVHVRNFALSNQSDVGALSNFILANRKSLLEVSLECIECPIDYNKQDKDGLRRFLDPILYASSRIERLDWLSVSTRTPPSHSSLITPKALRALSTVRILNILRLNSLGLNDSHCLVIAEVLGTPGVSVGHVYLEFNPAIGAQGYVALFGLNNRAKVVRYFHVDDKFWEAKLNLVSEMNHKQGRLKFMTDGVFSSEERRWQWLKKLASLSTSSDEEEAKQVSYILYTLLEHPDMMQTGKSRKGNVGRTDR